jgi:hypothetical protein
MSIDHLRNTLSGAVNGEYCRRHKYKIKCSRNRKEVVKELPSLDGAAGAYLGLFYLYGKLYLDVRILSYVAGLLHEVK